MSAEKILWDSTFALTPVYQERVWGGRRLESAFGRTLPDAVAPFGESWEVSDRDEAMSQVVGAGAGKDGLSLRELWQNHRKAVFGEAGVRMGGDRFPVLVKILDCREDLSLQVHPQAGKAEELGGEPKDEMWYVAGMDRGARLFAGLRQGVTRENFEKALVAGTVAEEIHVLEPEVGDFIFIPSGRVHAIGEGFLIFEIQQNSDTTYRVFDWNRKGLDGKPRELMIEKSLASIDFEDHEPSMGKAKGELLMECEHFRIHLWEMEPGSGRLCHQPGDFSIVAVVEGGVFFGGQSLAAGDFRIMPAAAGSEARPIVASSLGAKLLVTTLPG